MTPESSEQPRETRYGQAIPGTLGTTEEQRMLNDALVTGTGFMRDRKRIRPEDLQAEPMTATETRDGMPLVTREAFRREVRAKQVQILEGVGKVSSPELASLAAKYVSMSDDEMAQMLEDRSPRSQLATDVRSLAASVLAQAEGTPRK